MQLVTTISCCVCKKNFFVDRARRHIEYCELKTKLQKDLQSNKRDKVYV